jgi:copper homeostasis protein
MPPGRTLLEVAVETVADAEVAARHGADRLELCATLDTGGVTPTVETYKAVRAAVQLPVAVMIRPRPGDFVYSTDELSQMADDARQFADLGADALVFGALTWDNRLDTDALAELVRVTGSHEAVFHRAFDGVKHPDGALVELAQLGFKRLLTSGPYATAAEGITFLKYLVARADGKLAVIPGGGVKPASARAIVDGTGCTQIHGRFAAKGRTDAATVAAVRAALDQPGPAATTS